MEVAVAQLNSFKDDTEKKFKKIDEKLDKVLNQKSNANPKIEQDIQRQVQNEINKLKQDDFFKNNPDKNKEVKPGPENLKTPSYASNKTKPSSQTPKKTEPAFKKQDHKFATSRSSEALDIEVISASTGKGGMEVKEKKKNKDIETFLPSGSIFSGTLITGLDVSCGKSSRKDPFPVLLRVKKEAILPNMYRADVRECFLIAAGWGDLASERAYLRGERLSCIRRDGKALETKIEMWAVGEDGKAGVRGRLVNKTGALLGKALLAGFLQGFGQIFMKQPVLTIATQPQNQTPFQSNLSSNAMQTAGLQGAGSSMEMLAKYYIDMAKEVFPVIEIDAGRAVDFILISGKSLKLQARKLKDQ